MFRSRLSVAVAAAVVASLLAGSAQAGLHTPTALGDSGWAVTFESGINIVFQGVTNDRLEVKVNKLANFTEPPDRGLFSPLAVTFQQISHDAVPFIVVDAEEVLNNTGFDWIGFNFQVAEATDADDDDVHFDKDKTFGDDDPWDIDPFTEWNFSDDLTNLTLGGGVVPNGSVWTPGSGANGGELVIYGAPTQSGTMTAFVFKETPIIPLPAAAWTGLSGLLGLGLVHKARNFRRLLS